MKTFRDLNIKLETERFVGEKIKMMKVLNEDIVVVDFKINKSKLENTNSGTCLQLQIEFKGEKRVLFTGSKILTETINKVPEDCFPFRATIRKIGEAYQFE